LKIIKNNKNFDNNKNFENDKISPLLNKEAIKNFESFAYLF